MICNRSCIDYYNLRIKTIKNQIDSLKQLGVEPTIDILYDDLFDTGYKSYINGIIKDGKTLGVKIQILNNSEFYNSGNPFILNNKSDYDFYSEKNLDGNKNKAIAKGIYDYLINEYPFNLKQHRICVVGRSVNVGKPIILKLINNGLDVRVITKNMTEKDKDRIIEESNIIITCADKPIFKAEKFSKTQLVIDCGYSFIDGKAVGNVLNISEKNDNITPIKNGVNLLTRLGVMENLINYYCDLLAKMKY